MYKNEHSGENGCRMLLLIIEFIELLAACFTAAHIQSIMKFLFSILQTDVAHLEAQWAQWALPVKRRKIFKPLWQILFIFY